MQLHSTTSNQIQNKYHHFHILEVLIYILCFYSMPKSSHFKDVHRKWPLHGKIVLYILQVEGHASLAHTIQHLMFLDVRNTAMICQIHVQYAKKDMIIKTTNAFSDLMWLNDLLLKLFKVKLISTLLWKLWFGTNWS